MLSTTMRAARPPSVRAAPPAVLWSRPLRTYPSAPFEARVPSSHPRCSKAASSHCHFRIPARTISTKPPLQPKGIDREFEKEVAQKKIPARPEEVSTTSTVRNVLESSPPQPGAQVDVMGDLKNDLHTVKDTFALATVPREAYGLGLAGTLPYLATSLSTVFLSWNLNTEWPSQSAFLNTILLNPESATHWLQFLEPIQVGWGAVLISFLGAIHWGLEFAEKQASHDRTRLRYAVGVLAPAVAWPTIFLPVEWALTTQFAAFCALYYADSRASAKGWAPPWYGTYRFVLTAVVGVALLISLVGRAKVGEGHTRLSKADLKERLHKRPDESKDYHDWAKEEQAEKERMRQEKKREEQKRKEAEKKAKEEEGKKNQENEKASGEKSGEEKKESEEKSPEDKKGDE
ncbi:hypothetical protein N658DRAFT_459636 [Parathielavia hyrcaniae]|uniref:Mitochondrial inner membrane protein 1 n=1 Tax=Parathielavia hyrcaniae TaxID=113614 RepID=A0AAN6PV15_9PEZI|nr:hypothetical protein N658DRAFT_459636 [Parathielavia hyrcaniae]